MPIFDDVRGLVILPKSQTRKKSQAVNNSLDNPTEGVLSPEIPFPLPENNPLNVDLSNTIIDQVYTKISDFFQYVQMPVPDPLTEAYKITQGIENAIENPIDTLRRVAGEVIGGFTKELAGKNSKDLFPQDKHKDFKRQEDVIGLEDENGNLKLDNQGVRAPLGQTDPRSSERLIPKLRSDGSLKLNRSFKGRESIKDLTLRTTDLWDLKLDKFTYNGIKNKWVPDIISSDVKYLNQNNPYSNVIPSKVPILSDYMPITSYNLDLKTLKTKTLSLFGNSTVQVPELISYNSQLTFQIVDDENKRWRRWFQEYSENLFNSEDNTVAPYKNSSLLVTLVQYRQDLRVLAYNKYICTLANYQMISMGSDSGSTDVIDIELSIVGKVELSEGYSYLNIV